MSVLMLGAGSVLRMGDLMVAWLCCHWWGLRWLRRRSARNNAGIVQTARVEEDDRDAS